jgi:hypothetical protein
VEAGGQVFRAMPMPGTLVPMCDDCAKKLAVNNDQDLTSAYCMVCHEQMAYGWGRIPGEPISYQILETVQVRTMPAPGTLAPVCDDCAKKLAITNDQVLTSAYCMVCHEQMAYGWGKIPELQLEPGSVVGFFVGAP